MSVKKTFLSTLSLRRATVNTSFALSALGDFYPRSPCGERQHESADDMYQYQFLSTLSLRRATVTVLGIQHRVGISIHALLAESDRAESGQRRSLDDFYPRSPCGERRYSFRHSASCWHFYPRSPCGERPGKGPAVKGYRNFYPRSPCGERPILKVYGYGENKFLSTLSLRRATS